MADDDVTEDPPAEGEPPEGDPPPADPPPAATVTMEEYNKLTERMKAADRRAAAAEKKVKDAELADASEIEKAKAAAAEAEKERDEALARAREMELNQALLTDKTHGAGTWQDPSDILDMAQRAIATGDLEIDQDTGKVAKLSEWLAATAKKKPYLLKTTSTPPGGPASGAPVGSGKPTGTGKDLSDEELRRRFPALNR